MRFLDSNKSFSELVSLTFTEAVYLYSCILLKVTLEWPFICLGVNKVTPIVHVFHSMAILSTSCRGDNSGSFQDLSRLHLIWTLSIEHQKSEGKHPSLAPKVCRCSSENVFLLQRYSRISWFKALLLYLKLSSMQDILVVEWWWDGKQRLRSKPLLKSWSRGLANNFLKQHLQALK